VYWYDLSSSSDGGEGGRVVCFLLSLEQKVIDVFGANAVLLRRWRGGLGTLDQDLDEESGAGSGVLIVWIERGWCGSERGGRIAISGKQS
jgi:hypothetical protein